MVASRAMRAIRDLPLAASLALAGAALFFGGGALDGSLPWLGGGALLAVLASLLVAGVPSGLRTLIPLAALTAWLAVSIAWSTEPDRSWVYANRSFVYLLFALLGLWLALRTRELALGLALLLGLVAVWALAGKVLPVLYDYGPPGVARLRAPVGLWNQLALLGAFALPLGLWRRRVEGVLLIYVWIVAIALTGSRGGAAVAAVVVALWFVFGEERIAAATVLAAAALPAAAVAGIGFALPGVTANAQSSHVRWHDGLIFGAVVIVGGLAAALLSRVPAPRDGPALRRAAIVLGALVVAAILVVGAFKAGSTWRSFTSSAQVTNTGGRFTSAASNYRWVWWKQAWRGFRHHVLAGTGAGSFHLTNLRYRTSYLDETIEPHNLPLQMLSEAGLVGFVLFAAAAVALLLPGHRRHGPELALSLMLPAYLLHALVDVDWDFAAVSIPAFLAAGSLAGRPEPERRVSGFAVLAFAGAAVLAFGALLLPWLGARWAGDALASSSPSRAVTLARRAHSVDPLLLEPYWAQALAADQRNKPALAFSYYLAAVNRQPANPEAWLLAGTYALQQGCPRKAYTLLLQFTELVNQRAQADEGGDDYRRALALVNAGKARC